MKVIEPINLTGATTTLTRASIGTYFDKDKVMKTAGVDVPRPAWSPETGELEGALVEPARTNLLLNSASLSTQTRAVTSGTTYTLTFYGTGSITMSGAAAGTLQGVASYPNKRVSLTFTVAGSSLTLTVSGTVQYAQLEAGNYATSYIHTLGSTATRAADVIAGTGVFVNTLPLLSTNWNAAVTYQTGQKVTVGVRIYESLVDGNLDNDPLTTSTKGDPAAKWLDVGPTNPAACFDRTVSTRSTGSIGLPIALAVKLPKNANAIALMDVSATRVYATVQGGALTAARNTAKINSAIALTGFQPGDIVTIIIENAGGTPAVGEIVIGTLHDIGETKYGHRFSITDYSTKVTDEFGTSTFVVRPFAKRMSASVLVPKANYNNVINLLERIRANPTVWIASDDPDYSAGTIVYGNCADFDLEISYPTENLCNLEIQGLI